MKETTPEAKWCLPAVRDALVIRTIPYVDKVYALTGMPTNVKHSYTISDEPDISNEPELSENLKCRNYRKYRMCRNRRKYRKSYRKYRNFPDPG